MLQDLRLLLKQMNITLGQLQNKSGLSKSELSRIQNGKVIPRLDTLCIIAKSLDMEVNELIDILIRNEPWAV